MGRAVRSSVAAVLVLVVVGAGSWAVRPHVVPAEPALGAALSAVPRDALSVGFTHWRQLRSGPVPLADLADRDVATRSELYPLLEPMREVLGWSVEDLDWEVFAPVPGGNAVVARLGASVSPGEVADGLADAGFVRAGDRWTLAEADLATFGLGPLLQNVHVVAEQRLVVLSDSAAAAGRVVDVVQGGAPPITRDRSLVDVAGRLAGSDAVLLEREGVGCAATGMPDLEAQQQADVALSDVGGLEQYVASGRGIVDRGGDGFGAQDVRFAMRFEDPSTARDQLPVREAVSVGPFIGRTGDLADTLRLRDGSTDGATLTLDFAHDPRSDVIMTGVGALLFASC